MKIDGNESAFSMRGITVRALIAKDMLAAIIASADAREDEESMREGMELSACLAVEFADALIAELSKE